MLPAHKNESIMYKVFTFVSQTYQQSWASVMPSPLPLQVIGGEGASSSRTVRNAHHDLNNAPNRVRHFLLSASNAKSIDERVVVTKTNGKRVTRLQLPVNSRSFLIHLPVSTFSGCNCPRLLIGCCEARTHGVHYFPVH